MPIFDSWKIFPQRFPLFRTKNKLSLTCRQSLDHVTVTFLDALHKSAFFHQSFGRTLENTFASEKYKTPTSSISQGFPFSPRVVVPSARIHALHTCVVGMKQAHGLFFPFAPYVKSSLRRSGSGRARMTIFSVIERRDVERIAIDNRNNISPLIFRITARWNYIII